MKEKYCRNTFGQTIQPSTINQPTNDHHHHPRQQLMYKYRLVCYIRFFLAIIIINQTILFPRLFTSSIWPFIFQCVCVCVCLFHSILFFPFFLIILFSTIETHWNETKIHEVWKKNNEPNVRERKKKTWRLNFFLFARRQPVKFTFISYIYSGCNEWKRIKRNHPNYPSIADQALKTPMG